MSEAKTVRISVRAEKATIDLIDHASELLGMSRSKFIRHCAETDAKIVIGDNPPRKRKKTQHAT